MIFFKKWIISTRPTRVQLHLLLLEIFKGKNFKTLLDVGCGYMAFINRLKHERYIGIDIDANRIRSSLKKYPNAEGYVGDLFNLKTNMGDSCLCLQVFNNKYFDNRKTLEAVNKLTDAVVNNGRLIFNIGNKSYEYASEIDLILRKNFKEVKAIKYGGTMLDFYCPILISLLLGYLSYFLKKVNIFLGSSNKILYYCDGKI